MQVGSLQELRDRLSRIAKIKVDSRVILHPDPAVPLGDVIDVYDSARLIGFKKIEHKIRLADSQIAKFSGLFVITRAHR